MRILVLGAGVVGTTSAWYLARAGHQVRVVDRQAVPGNETSFANGGQISVSHAEPWANPHVLPRLLQWLGRADAPLLWRWRADAAQWAWGLRFLRECLPGRSERNMAAIVRLALYSRRTLQALRRDVPLAYDHLERGILHLYTNHGEWQRAIAAAHLMRRFGLDRSTVDADQCLEIEPALTTARPLLVGGDYTPSDESGDAHRFTRALAEHARQAGVEFCLQTTVDRLQLAGGRVAGVVVRHDGADDLWQADAYVLALGSYSPLLLRPLGVRLPVYPAKGYSATFALANPDSAPTVSLTDDQHKLVFSRLGDRLRVAGTAEFNGYNLDLDAARCAAVLRRTQALFPQLEVAGEPTFWCGLRPATPSNVPLIGRSPIERLWLNTGHGTLGWTLSCGSAAVLADLLDGKQAAVEFPIIG
ncbi:MAG: D-amino acid dehydrogenase [Dechloromonas sp.]|nr:D-amino acid dehydrogenase [Dechloromonas sp.]